MKVLIGLLFGFVLADHALAATDVCRTQGVEVESDRPEYVGPVCDAVSKAEKLLVQCALPGITDGLRIEVVDSLGSDCVGVYHCGDNAISVLTEQAMEAVRSPGAFSHLEIGPYFQSVVVHEVAHAAFSGLPCPFEACVVAQEYGAYALQIMSLSAADREMFVQRSDIKGRVSSEELSAIYLFLAPDRFARKVWAHLQQREDQCAYLRGIANGSVLLDRGRF